MIFGLMIDAVIAGFLTFFLTFAVFCLAAEAIYWWGERRGQHDDETP